jgi:hypothetical protein
MSESPPPQPLPAPSTLSRLPIALVMALAVEIAIEVAFVCGWRGGESTTWRLLWTGESFATAALMIVGTRELARRTAGATSIGLRVASAIAIGMVVLQILGEALPFLLTHEAIAHAVFTINHWMWFGIGFAFAASICVAGWASARSWGVRVAVVLLGVTAMLTVPLISDALFEASSEGVMHAVVAAIHGVKYTAILAIVIGVSRRAAPRIVDLQRAVPTLRLIATSLVVRVWVAGATIAMLVPMFMLRGESGLELFRFVAVAAPAVGAIAVVVFGAAALRLASNLGDDEPRGRAFLGGALAVAGGAIAAAQTMWSATVIYGWSSYRDLGADTVAAAPLLVPILVTVAIVIVLVTIVSMASRRDKPELASTAIATLFPFLILQTVAVLIQTYGLPRADTQTEMLGLTFVGSACGLVALALVVSTCRRAANELASPISLPTATLR